MNQLKTIAGLGGVEQKISPYFFESDDVKETEVFWQSTQSVGFPGAGAKVVNAAMLRWVASSNRERATGGVRLFFRLHTLAVVFRYGRANDFEAEKTFEAFIEKIVDKIEGNDTIFKRPAIGVAGNFHPQPDAEQTAKVSMVSEKLFHVRGFKAEIELAVVEHVVKT